jgi:hypothetical protein
MHINSYRFIFVMFLQETINAFISLNYNSVKLRQYMPNMVLFI